MKTLTLLRHAKSGHDPHIARDFDRPLNAKGKRAAAMMGRHARSLGLTFDHAIASPAVRVEETITAFAEGYGETLAPIWDRKLYLASAATLLDAVHSCSSAHNNLLIIGHNPGFEDLVLMLAAQSALRTIAEDKLPTASIAQLRHGDGWNGFVAGSADLTLFVRPRDLDPGLGPDTD